MTVAGLLSTLRGSRHLTNPVTLRSGRESRGTCMAKYADVGVLARTQYYVLV
jgi:hypothetical protein